MECVVRYGMADSENSNQNEKLLWYFADPMCSWCWGFAPVIDEVKRHYSENFRIALILGGLRPGTTEPVEENFRQEILHHWREVHNRTGQEFQFDDAMPEGFVYDTEPPSRAVVTMGEIKPDSVLTYLKVIQAGFYVEQKDVTQEKVLVELAARFEIYEDGFRELFHSEAMKNRTLAHFQRARQFGVRGFPSLVLQNAEGFTLLSHGYRPFSELAKEIDEWLS